ncbi:heterokaryon incompatibility protein-domain-containing protein [Lophiotrema nucula]|uniref:Heterokaryon incompatibility protein-domain-containing protein n=1 Tax=Lophiotrema nucula TaxID=690887 RepID=A0A6A5YLB5_9PLEO|nr:heterokaryon incompatibility protein-domain-containing protein [Lophiotrema nucula]
MAPVKECYVCEAAVRQGNEAVVEHYDNFRRFYERHLLKGKRDEIEKHKFQYQAIDSESCTRLLEIMPGYSQDPIVCTLRAVDIDKPPEYTALSYVWGTSHRTRTIKVDGEDFLVTDNLWYALWHIRLPNRSSMMWVDAICIDQENIDERNQSVGNMKSIYENAHEILAWLGPDDQGGCDAMGGIFCIYDHYTRLIDKYGTPDAAFKHMVDTNNWYGDLAPDEETRIGNWSGITRLLSLRTWFHRVWILQEGTVPVKTTFRLCDYQVSAKAVYEVISMVDRCPFESFPRNIIKESGFEKTFALANLAKKRRVLQKRSMKAAKQNDFPLLDILATMRHHKASDPHDKVYAAIGFATDIPEDAPIPIDYRKSFSEMLRDVALTCLHQESHQLRFLGFAGLLGTWHMPASWIPDWLFSGDLSPLPKEVTTGPDTGKSLFDACGSNHRVWKEKEYRGLAPFVNEHTLTVHGILVDTIRSKSLVAGEDQNLGTLETTWMLPNMIELYEPTGEIMEAAYLSTLVSDLKMKDGEVIGRGGRMYWRNRENRPADHVYTQQAIYQACRYRSFITTLKHRYIGLAPYWCLQGDAIFMLKGGEVLYLARPTVNGTYHYVGEVYLHGMMDGAVLDRFERGDGAMQTIEFVPVRNEVVDSTKAIPTAPVNKKVAKLAPNINSVQYTNVYEELYPFHHIDVGPRIDEYLQEVIVYLMNEVYMETGSERAAYRAVWLANWQDRAEEALLNQVHFDVQATTSKNGLAGREFAIRSYIRAAMALEKERMETQKFGQFRNVLDDGQVLLLGHESERYNDYKKPEPKEKRVERQLSHDERLARQLQEEEYLRFKHQQPASNKPHADRISTHRADPEWPLRRPKRGPPVRLMHQETRGPRHLRYTFQKPDEHFSEFAADLAAIQERGEIPPLLFGKWATDPECRPSIQIVTYGHPGRIWWEDDYGNEVDGPDLSDFIQPEHADRLEDEEFTAQMAGMSYARGMMEDLRENYTDDNGNVVKGVINITKIPSYTGTELKEKEILQASHSSYLLSTKDWKKAVSDGRVDGSEEPSVSRGSNFHKDESSWSELVANGDWEGEEEAHVPGEFVLSLQWDPPEDLESDDVDSGLESGKTPEVAHTGQLNFVILPKVR